MLIKIEEILLKERPNIVLVYGDTNSTLAAALAASKLNIPVAHVEAGIRSNNFSVPEELNRRMTDHISTLLFPPTRAGVEHLLREGIPEAKIHLVGDVMYDLSIVSGQIAALESKVLDQLRVSKRSFVLATIHRAENTDSPLRIQSILKLLELIAKEIPVVLPVHPRSRPIINSYFASKPSNNGLILTDPVGYFDMVQLEQNALAIVTDSGGVQKEAYFHKVPCVTTKDDTEWPETVSAGCNFLASPGNAEAMFEIFKNALKSKCNWGQSFYGNGDAGVKIVSRIEQMSDWSSSQVSQ
jgi:UDP-GlcNAc3NAcA epimerase